MVNETFNTAHFRSKKERQAYVLRQVNVYYTLISAAVPHRGLEIVVAGNKPPNDLKGVVGANATEQIHVFNAERCFLGTNAIAVQHGLTNNDQEVVQAKRVMIAAEVKMMCLTASENLQTHQPVQVCGLQRFNHRITKPDPGHQALRPFVDAGITVL